MAIKQGDKVIFNADVKVLKSINREGKPEFINDVLAGKIAGKEGIVLAATDLMLYGERIAVEVTVEFDKALGIAPLKLTDKHFRKISDLKKQPKASTGKWGHMSVLLNARRDARLVLTTGVKAIQKGETAADIVILDSISKVQALLDTAKTAAAEIKAGTFKAPPTPPVKNPGSKGGKTTKPKTDKPAAPAKK